MKWVYAQAAFIPIILSHFKDKMPINELVLATNSYLYDPGTTSLDDLFIDPGYNLK